MEFVEYIFPFVLLLLGLGLSLWVLSAWIRTRSGSYSNEPQSVQADGGSSSTVPPWMASEFDPRNN